jgi:hypothetical protein
MFASGPRPTKHATVLAAVKDGLQIQSHWTGCGDAHP